MSPQSHDNREVVYEGKRSHEGALVLRREGELPPTALPWRLDLVNHSPTGLEWGYGGSGPAQLALALLADALQDDEAALRLYQTFKWEVVASLPWQEWTLTQGDVQYATLPA